MFVSSYEQGVLASPEGLCSMKIAY